jgi:predicted DNA repair protein MutK/heat shock protein HslJ
MASGLFALLDDVAGIAKAAAASVDDVMGAAGKAGSKAVGVVVDDAAVTPGYAMGFTPARELPIVFKIALGSLRNKFLFLLPGALLLSAFAPWAVTPILMMGGTYLCFEAAEKLWEAMSHEEPSAEPENLALTSEALEAQKVSGAIRTDLILSAEIMAISLADVTAQPLTVQAGALAVVGLLITIGVYGLVGLIVKIDDIGLHLAGRKSRSVQALGLGLVRAMPVVLSLLAKVGTAAMLWVGGGIIVHGLHSFGVHGVPEAVEIIGRFAGQLPAVGPAADWIARAAASGVLGLAIGAAIVAVLHWVKPGHAKTKDRPAIAPAPTGPVLALRPTPMRPVTPPTPPSPDPLAGDWAISRLDGETPPSLLPTLTFEGGEFGGRVCNRYSGIYEIEGESLRLSHLFHTCMACHAPDDPGLMAREARLMQLLPAVERFRREEGRLTLVTGDGRTIELVPAPPRPPPPPPPTG